MKITPLAVPVRSLSIITWNVTQGRHWNYRGLSNAAGAEGERRAIPTDSMLKIFRKWIYGDQGAHIRDGAGELNVFDSFPTFSTCLRPRQAAKALLPFTWEWQGLPRESDRSFTNTHCAHSPAGGPSQALTPSMAPYDPAHFTLAALKVHLFIMLNRPAHHSSTTPRLSALPCNMTCK